MAKTGIPAKVPAGSLVRQVKSDAVHKRITLVNGIQATQNLGWFLEILKNATAKNIFWIIH